jgi:hypothetical protein
LRDDLHHHRVATDPHAENSSWIDRTGEKKMPEYFPEPLALIELALRAPAAAKSRYPDYRLTKLVASRLELDDADMKQLSAVLATDLSKTPETVARPFDHQLRNVISHYKLDSLFSDGGPGAYHHAIRPTGYDFDYDEVIPAGMEQWRADYRAMSDERQMLAASIIWLYRAGKDNRWLRRVPCTWHAADAIGHMHFAGVLTDWARLFALYPGW